MHQWTSEGSSTGVAPLNHTFKLFFCRRTIFLHELCLWVLSFLKVGMCNVEFVKSPDFDFHLPPFLQSQNSPSICWRWSYFILIASRGRLFATILVGVHKFFFRCQLFSPSLYVLFSFSSFFSLRLLSLYALRFSSMSCFLFLPSSEYFSVRCDFFSH